MQLGVGADAQETREAQQEIQELPGMEKWGKKTEPKTWNRRHVEEEKGTVVGSSQPWVGIMRAR